MTVMNSPPSIWETPVSSYESNFINKLCEDNFKRIWAVSEMGIDILDIQTMQTVQVTDMKDKLISTV